MYSMGAELVYTLNFTWLDEKNMSDNGLINLGLFVNEMLFFNIPVTAL